MRLIMVSGLSGAGKSVALQTLEDMGYHCADNLPLELLPSFVETTLRWQSQSDNFIAVGVDARGARADLDQFPRVVTALREKFLDTQILFLRATDDVLIQRYSETRRKHPLSHDNSPLVDAIRRERQLLEPVADVADLTIDTSRMNVHELRQLVRSRLQHDDSTEDVLSIQFVSFGFKYGVPADADYVFDVRCLPNPHWVPGLRSLTGRDREVVSFLEAHSEVGEMFRDIKTFLSNWLPRFGFGLRSYLTVAVGCTGGHHRSVYLVDRLARHFDEDGTKTMTRHRELS